MPSVPRGTSLRVCASTTFTPVTNGMDRPTSLVTARREPRLRFTRPRV